MAPGIWQLVILAFIIMLLFGGSKTAHADA